MSRHYEIMRYTPDGIVLNTWTDLKPETTFNYLRFIYGKGTPGALDIVIPDKGYSPSDFESGQILEVYRVVDGVRNLEGERLWIIRKFLFDEESQTWYIGAYDLNKKIAEMIAAYKATTSQADKTDYLDDMAKAIISENIGSTATDTDRTISAVSVAADLSLAPSKKKSFSYRNLLMVLNEICDMSAGYGTYLTYDFVRTGRAAVEFRTYTGQRGNDFTGANKRILSKDMKNLANGTLEYNFEEEINTVYVGGQGEDEDRVVVEVEDTTKNAVNQFARTESFVDARDVTDDTDGELTNRGQAELYEKRASVVLTGQVQEVAEKFRYGIEFGYGDKLVAQIKGVVMDVHIEKVDITVKTNGEEYELLNIKVRGEA